MHIFRDIVLISEINLSDQLFVLLTISHQLEFGKLFVLAQMHTAKYIFIHCIPIVL